MEAIDRACNAVGGASALAILIDVSPQAVYLWKRNGVPAERVLQIERETGVHRSELRPDIYPPDEYVGRRKAKAAA